jgi:uncharacterized membrane protein
MLLLMIGPWLLARRRNASPGRAPIDLAAAGAFGMGLLFLFTASGHFAQADAMVQMLPPWVPHRLALVHGTGVLEIAIALGFFVARTRRLAAWSALAVLVLFFPANVYAALVEAPMGGHAWGPAYLLIRAPLQAAIVLWTAVVVLGLRPRRAIEPCGR